MHRTIFSLIILLFISGYSFSQEKGYRALDFFNDIINQITESRNDNSSLIKKIEQLCSLEIRDSSNYTFDDYLNHINNLNDDKTIPAAFHKLQDVTAEVIFDEFMFRTLVAVQQNLERLYWKMPDLEKYKSSVIFATINKELSHAKTGLLSKQLSIVASSNDNSLKQRTWLAMKRMLNEIDIPLSESGNEFVQRSPYGLMIRKGELSNRLKMLAENESNSDIKEYAQHTVQIILTSGKKYIDPGKPIVIGAGPEITELISKEAFLFFNAALANEDHLQKIGYYTKAIDTDSDFAAAYFNRAVSYFELKNYPAAINDFEHVLQVDSNQNDVYSRLGDSYLKTEQYKSAIKNYSKALELESEEKAILLISRGIAHEKLHQYSSAIKDFTDAIELDSVSISAYNNRVKCFVETKDFNKAIEDYNTLIKLRPDNSTYYFNLGCIYWEHRNWEKVYEIWEKGLAVNPEDENILKNLPEIKSKLK